MKVPASPMQTPPVRRRITTADATKDYLRNSTVKCIEDVTRKRGLAWRIVKAARAIPDSALLPSQRQHRARLEALLIGLEGHRRARQTFSKDFRHGHEVMSMHARGAVRLRTVAAPGRVEARAELTERGFDRVRTKLMIGYAYSIAENPVSKRLWRPIEGLIKKFKLDVGPSNSKKDQHTSPMLPNRMKQRMWSLLQKKPYRRKPNFKRYRLPRLSIDLSRLKDESVTLFHSILYLSFERNPNVVRRVIS